jgi:peptidoglycan/xylan/chitin deacetylase (PgdA/CDA1 family)
MPSAVACFTFDHLRADAPYREIDAVLDRHGVHATFFVERRDAARDPEAVVDIVARGHEVGCHGWAHEQWSELSPDKELELATRARDALRAAGARPEGFRAPGGARTAATADILASLDFRYDASLGDGMRVARLGPSLAQVPFVWSGVDGAYYLGDEPRPAEEVRDGWLQTLETVAARGGLFVLICHPEITGNDPSRVDALAAVIYAAVSDPRVEVTTIGGVARAELTA